VVLSLSHQTSSAYLQYALAVAVQVVHLLNQVAVVVQADLHKVGLMQQILAP
jgi:hypothetical protein